MKTKRFTAKISWAKGLLAAATALGIGAAAGLVPAGRRVRGATGGVVAVKAASNNASTAGEPQPARPAPTARQTAEAAKPVAGKRDPFRVPPPPRKDQGRDFGGPLPPGKRGLIIGQLRLEGTVRQLADQTMLAVVTNQTNLAYFLRVHDKVYNGVVVGITADSIRFREDRLGSDGRLETREVVLKMGSPQEEGR